MISKVTLSQDMMKMIKSVFFFVLFFFFFKQFGYILYLDLGTCKAMSIHVPTCRTEHVLEFNLRM